MTRRTIVIEHPDDGATDDARVERVQRTLYEVDGLTVRTVTVSSAVVECDDANACEIACELLVDAGLVAHPLEPDPSVLLPKPEKEAQAYPPVTTETTASQLVPKQL